MKDLYAAWCIDIDNCVSLLQKKKKTLVEKYFMPVKKSSFLKNEGIPLQIVWYYLKHIHT